jgi:putative tricarboxylic transport membrane protein
MWIVLAVGVRGWIMSKTGFDAGPLVLAFVLGPILEKSFRQSMLISGGSLDIFVTDPAAAIIFSLILAGIVINAISGFRRRLAGTKASLETPVAEEEDPQATSDGGEPACSQHHRPSEGRPAAQHADKQQSPTAR